MDRFDSTILVLMIACVLLTISTIIPTVKNSRKEVELKESKQNFMHCLNELTETQRQLRKSEEVIYHLYKLLDECECKEK